MVPDMVAALHLLLLHLLRLLQVVLLRFCQNIVRVDDVDISLIHRGSRGSSSSRDGSPCRRDTGCLGEVGAGQVARPSCELGNLTRKVPLKMMMTPTEDLKDPTT